MGVEPVDHFIEKLLGVLERGLVFRLVGGEPIAVVVSGEVLQEGQAGGVNHAAILTTGPAHTFPDSLRAPRGKTLSAMSPLLIERLGDGHLPRQELAHLVAMRCKSGGNTVLSFALCAPRELCGTANPWPWLSLCPPGCYGRYGCCQPQEAQPDGQTGLGNNTGDQSRRRCVELIEGRHEVL